MSWSFYFAAIPAVVLLGLAKRGFAGVGMVAMPIMAMVMSPVEAAAVLLPILLVQDAVSMASYRHSFDMTNLRVLLPGAFVGICIGYYFAASASDAAISIGVGFILIAFGAHRYFAERKGIEVRANSGRRFFGFACGAASGLTSMIVHAGGPPFQIYVVPQRLPHRVFVGTTVFFFAILNIAKVVPYFLLGQLTRENLMLSATLAPLAIASTYLGIRLVGVTSAENYYKIINIVIVAVGTKLLIDGVLSLPN